jgi:ABC-type multidrug transport system ATPase subunit
MPFPAASIEMKGLQLERGGQVLFEQPVSGTFVPGVLNILTGLNGSGKTSLLDIIAFRTNAPQSDVIHWNGCAKATEVAYLPQQLWDVFDIRISHLLMLARAHRDSDRSDPPGTLVEVLAHTDKELGALSGGQRQLLLFWLVSTQTQRFYVYDEPLRNLDKIAGQYVIDAIEKQVRAGVLVVLSEHSLVNHWSVPCNRLVLTKHGSS